MTGPESFDFLSVCRTLNSATDWNNPDWAKLWLYNVHYFDDLVADNAGQRFEWHLALINRWIAENPPATGNGWEPYPTSLRIVNWIKWQFTGNTLSESAIHNLAIQTRFLTKSLEFHLLGNHLWANAKALCFAGAFFEGNEAEAWLEEGSSLIQDQLTEQILTDGGHFERSPMYHAIILEDVLDLIQLERVIGRKIWSDRLRHSMETSATNMLRWLSAMTHPDGGIALFNDATFGISPDLATLESYALAGNLKPAENITAGTHYFAQSGYVVCHRGPWYLIADIGKIGPDYLPGHAHADTLGFELSFNGIRLFVDSGISTYETNPLRHFQRSTAAHNTVTVAGEDSSSIWGGFRVAHRAKPIEPKVTQYDDKDLISAGHDGYTRLKSRNIHFRTWSVFDDRIVIEDTVSGQPASREANLYIGPEFVAQKDDNGFRITHKESGMQVMLRFSESDIALADSLYYCGFGRAVKNQRIQVSFSSDTLKTTIIAP